MHCRPRLECGERNISRTRTCETQALIQTIERYSTPHSLNHLTQLFSHLGTETDLEHHHDPAYKVRTLTQTWIFLRDNSNSYRTFVVANEWKHYLPSIIVAIAWSIIHFASTANYRLCVSLALHGLFIVALWCVFAIRIRGPGLISLGASVAQTSGPDCPKYERHSLDAGEETLVLVTRRCQACNTIRPPRTSHCRRCDICVPQFDHHCVILNSCIGRDNISPFILLVIVALAYSCVNLVGAILYIDEAHLVSFATIAISTFSIPPLLWASVLYGKLYFLFGITFWEYNKRGDGLEGYELTNDWREIPRPFDLGCSANFCSTLFSKRWQTVCM